MESVEVKTFQEYTKAAMRTATASSLNEQYMVLELISEAGEVAGAIAKAIRDDGAVITPERRELIIKELGDCLWGLAGLYHIGLLTEEYVKDFADYDIDLHEKYKEYLNEESRYEVQVHDVAVGVCGAAIGCSQNIIIHKDGNGFAKSLFEAITFMAHQLHTDLGTVAQKNIDKLADRYNRGVIGGFGDER